MTKNRSRIRPTGRHTFNPQSEIARHLARMSPSYAATFSRARRSRHAELAARLSDRNPVEVAAEHLEEGYWRVTIVAYDYLGELSLICGLLFAYGFSIVDGQVFTYEPRPRQDRPAGDAAGVAAGRRGRPPPQDRRRVHRAHVDRGAPRPRTRRNVAQLRDRPGRAAAAARRRTGSGRRRASWPSAWRWRSAGVEAAAPALHPIDIEIDNDASDRYTLLRIERRTRSAFSTSSPTPWRSTASTSPRSRSPPRATACRTRSTSPTRGRRITSPEKQRELRAATVLVKHFTHLLPHSPNPEAALLHFHEYLGELFARPSWPDELASLERPEVLDALARLLGVSEFLWDDFLRMQYANLFPVVQDVDALATGKTPSAAGRGAGRRAGRRPPSRRHARATGSTPSRTARCSASTCATSWATIAGFGQFSAELTDLAEVVVEAAVALLRGGAAARSTASRCERTARPARLCVCALGKCGGRELGFASDIELMFVYRRQRADGRPARHHDAEFYEKLVIEFTARDPRPARGHLPDRPATAALRQGRQPGGLARFLPALFRARRSGLELRAPGAGQAAPDRRR